MLSKICQTFGGLVLTLAIGLLTFSTSVSADSTKNITVVNPIRGLDFWDHKYNLLDTPKQQYQIISQKKLSATWLVRYDALKNPEVVSFLKSLNSDQEIGIFMEITPTLTSDAKVQYNNSQSWHSSKSVLLTGYTPADRVKLIDQVFTKYHEVFNTNPKSVGAWWIDADSLQMMHDKYQIETSLDVSDQYSTDQYQIWGQYWSLPFYPAKNNALLPAPTVDKKIGLVTIQWANRDPYNAYGNGVGDSTYSVQANDYLLHDLGISYFQKLLNIYPQLTVGLENDFDWQMYGPEYQNQINLISAMQSQGKLSVRTMSQFADVYKSTNPTVSPKQLVVADDPIGSYGKVVWYQTPKYRVGWFYGPYGSAIRDLRMYDISISENCLKQACQTLDWQNTFLNAIDEVTYGTRWVIDEGTIKDVSVRQTEAGVTISYTNQASSRRTIQLLDNDIQVDSNIYTIPVAIANHKLSKQSAGLSSEQNISSFNINWSAFLKSFPVDALKFIVLSIIFFVMPGYGLTRRWLMAIPVGWAIFTLSSFIAGYLHLWWLLWLLPLATSFIWYKNKLYQRLSLDLKHQNWWLVGLISIGSLNWIIPVFRSGMLYDFGLGYWGPNGHDAIWHLGLIEVIKNGLPVQNPVFAGTMLRNYHYLFDLLLSSSSLLFSIDSQNLIFRLFPILISLLAGGLVYRLTYQLAEKQLKFSLSQSNLAGLISVFLIYFGGSLGWLVSLLRNRSLYGESMFWAQQGVSTLINPPFAISIVFLLAGAIYIYDLNCQNEPLKQLLKTKSVQLRAVLPLILMWGLLIEFKAYAGVLALVALGLFSLEKLIARRDFGWILLCIPIYLLTALVFLPNNWGGGNLFVWSPGWFVSTMLEFQDRLYLPRLLLAIQSGTEPKVAIVYLVATIIFIVGNLGSRVVGLAYPKSFFKISLLGYISLLGFVLPMLFIQKGTNWNSIQFFYYCVLTFDIWAALAIAKYFDIHKVGIKLIIVLALGLFTLPTSYDSLSQDYLTRRPPNRISISEVEALNFLKTQPAGTVINIETNPTLDDRFDYPKPLYSVLSTAYIPALTGHPVFIGDVGNLEIMDVDFKGRLNLQRDFPRIKEKSRAILVNNNIKYIYILKAQRFDEDDNSMGTKTIFENSEVKILKVI